MKVAIALVKLGLGCHAAVTSCVWLTVGSLLPPWFGLLRWRQLHIWARQTAQSHRRCGSRGLVHPSSGNDGCSTYGMGPHLLVVSLRHCNSVGIAEIADVDPIGFPGRHSCDRCDHGDTEGDCSDGQRDVG